MHQRFFDAMFTTHLAFAPVSTSSTTSALKLGVYVLRLLIVFPLLGVYYKDSRSCGQDHCVCARFFVALLLRPVLRSPSFRQAPPQRSRDGFKGAKPPIEWEWGGTPKEDNAVKDLNSYLRVLILPAIVLCDPIVHFIGSGGSRRALHSSVSLCGCTFCKYAVLSINIRSLH